MPAALAAHCALGRRILHLLKAAVGTLEAYFSRRSWHLTKSGETPPDYARAPNALLIGVTGSSFRTISGLCTGAALIFAPVPLVTSDLPMKVAPSSITRRL